MEAKINIPDSVLEETARTRIKDLEKQLKARDNKIVRLEKSKRNLEEAYNSITEFRDKMNKMRDKCWELAELMGVERCDKDHFYDGGW
jgi:hypothetical protein